MIHDRLRQHLENLGASIEEPEHEHHVIKIPGAATSWHFNNEGDVAPVEANKQVNPERSDYLSYLHNSLYNPHDLGYHDRLDTTDRSYQETSLLGPLAANEKHHTTDDHTGTKVTSTVGQWVGDNNGKYELAPYTHLWIRPKGETGNFHSQGSYYGPNDKEAISPTTAALAHATLRGDDNDHLALHDHLIEHHTQSGHSNYNRHYSRALQM